MTGMERLRWKAHQLRLLFLLLISGAVRLSHLREDTASIELDFKAIALFTVLVVVVVIGAAIYFTITTPAGQTGLAGIGQSIAGAIAAPFIAIGNGIGSFFSNLFGGLGNALSHLL